MLLTCLQANVLKDMEVFRDLAEMFRTEDSRKIHIVACSMKNSFETSMQNFNDNELNL